MSLALGLTLDQLFESMPLAEFKLRWLDYQQNPWGTYRSDTQAAMITSAIINSAGKSMKKGSSVGIEDFLLFGSRPKKEEVSPDEIFKGLKKK